MDVGNIGERRVVSPPEDTPGYLVVSICMLAFGAGGLYWCITAADWNILAPYLVSVLSVLFLIWSPILFGVWVWLRAKERKEGIGGIDEDRKV